MSYSTQDWPVEKVVEYEFVIKNFVAIQSQLTPDDFVKSPTFPQSDLPQWSVAVYPRGLVDTEKFKFKVLAELEKTQLGKTSEVFAVTFRFLNDNRSVLMKQHFTSREVCRGSAIFFGIHADFTMAIPVSDCGDLIVNVEITLKGQKPIIVPPSKFSLDFSTALQSGILSDFTVVSSDKREFPTHKIILAMRVPHMERKFKSGWEKVKRKRVEVEFSGDCVEALLEYVYSDKVASPSGIAVELLQMAHVYEMDRLMAICVAEMVKNLNEENLSESSHIANLCGIIPLQSACRKFIDGSASAAKLTCAQELQTVPLPLGVATYDFSENKMVENEFVIKNFAATRSQLNEIVKSPIFPPEDLPQWRIIVFPRGGFIDSTGKKCQFAVIVVGQLEARLGKSSGVFAVKYQFLNDNRSVILQKLAAYEERYQYRMLTYRIAADATETVPLSDSGDLIVNVQISLVGQTGYDIGVPPSTFLHTFSSALQSGILSDFTVVSSDQCEFPVHKIILAVRVPFFDRMFDSDMAEVKTKRVEVEFSGDCVEAMLEYVYKDQVVKLSEIAVELVQLARVYCIDRLVSICTAEMVKNLDEENLCESLKLANLLGIVSLRSACEKFIADHPEAEAKLTVNDIS